MWKQGRVPVPTLGQTVVMGESPQENGWEGTEGARVLENTLFVDLTGLMRAHGSRLLGN